MINAYQNLWWRQIQSDHAVLVLLRQQGAAPCHQLHYLQMVTEKLAKAYFWRSGVAPPRQHAGFVQFLRSLGGLRHSNRQDVAEALGFRSFEQFQTWIHTILPLAYDLERLAPNLANDGPNPEYPWPHHAPTNAPASSTFELWIQLTKTGLGRQLVQVIQSAVDAFSYYG